MVSVGHKHKQDATCGNCRACKTCVFHTCLDLILALCDRKNIIPVNLYFQVLFLHDIYFSFCKVGEFVKTKIYVALVNHLFEMSKEL
jgi:hypothetical protein